PRVRSGPVGAALSCAIASSWPARSRLLYCRSMIPRVEPEGMLFRKPVSTPDQVRGKLFRDHALWRHGEKFLSKLTILAEAAEHAAGDQVGVGLVNAARGHAVMRRLDDDGDTFRPEHVVDRVRDLGRQPFLDLHALRESFHHAGELADADDAAV